MPGYSVDALMARNARPAVRVTAPRFIRSAIWLCAYKAIADEISAASWTAARRPHAKTVRLPDDQVAGWTGRRRTTKAPALLPGPLTCSFRCGTPNGIRTCVATLRAR